MDIDSQFENIKNLTKQLDEINELNNQAFSKLDPQTYEKVKDIQIDTNRMLREVKKGNYQVIDDMLKKYNK